MKVEKKTRAALKIRKNYNEKEMMKKFKQPVSVRSKKKPKKVVKRKDEENILSKDINIDDDMKDFERINENRQVKQRDLTNLKVTQNYVKNLKFKPMKYKGNYLPYHLRWILSNSVKSNEIVLIQEIEALEVTLL